MRRQQDGGQSSGGAPHEVDDDDDDGPADVANLSAELRYEAPLATFDGDEWTEFLLDVPPPPVPPPPSDDDDCFRGGDVISGGEATFSETFTGSLEDLVNTFDDKITQCFRNYNEHADEIAPVQIRTQDELLADSQTWWTITGNVAGDWSKMYNLPTDVLLYSTADIGRSTNRKRSISSTYSSYSSDADERAEVHSSRDDVTSGGDEPLVTADDVISEIESMMEDNSSMLDRTRRTVTSSVTSRPDLLRLSSVHKSTTTPRDGTTGLECLSVGGLAELSDELQRCVHEYSEDLVAELARRDELDFEKELKNQFIWLLLRVQKRRRELVQLESRAAVTGISRSNGKPAPNSEYLKTVIPYEPSRGAPTPDRLQIYIKILAAINDDSGTVPTLLTDYILNVLCPTTA